MTDRLTLHADSQLVAAPGWWLIRRLPDDRFPAHWERRPVAMFTLGREDGAVQLVAVLGDGTVMPCRRAELGRDGHDYHQREDTFGVCDCAAPVPALGDPGWCSYCAGLRFVHGLVDVEGIEATVLPFEPRPTA